ncbi:MAG: eukaryotic-like serine/threonine-protein kinase [Gaiellaceae bacterium]|nr:eukaryotic-like serine/threonine-protein kinase [Gaiellaceae bacterium]
MLTTALAVAIAVLATLVIVLFVVLIVRKPAVAAPVAAAPPGEDGVAAVVADMNARLEQLSDELAAALSRAEEEGRRSRFLGELAGSIDLDEVLSRTLEAAGALRGVDAALVTITSPEGKQVVATLGLSAEEAERQAVVGPPDGRSARSIAIGYRYGEEELAANGSLIHSGLAVPLAGEGETLGYLTVFSRSSAHTFGDSDVGELEELAYRAGPAIENARRFKEARQLADLDALTSLHNRRYFHETLAREVARGHRYNRRLALIVFDLDDFKTINDRIGHLAGDSVLADVAERVRDVVRSADIACRVGGDEFAVILPESTLEDADQLYRRIQHSVSGRPIGQEGRIHLSAGVTELRSEDDAVAFFQRADDALYRAKEGGKGRMVAANNVAG